MQDIPYRAILLQVRVGCSAKDPQQHGCCVQISKYVEREIINHKQLMHPHIVEIKEVQSYRLKGGAQANAHQTLQLRLCVKGVCL